MSESMQRGPNYDWKHEAEHYEAECIKLRELLSKVESQGERDAWKADHFENALEMIASQVTWVDQKDQKILLTYALGTIEVARQALAQITVSQP